MNENEKFFCKLCCRKITPDINNTYKGYCKSCYNEKFNINQPKRKLYQNWWFWLLIIIILIAICFGINSYIDNKKLEEKFSHIGNGASDFITGIDDAKSHLNEFSYNSTTGNIDYKPSTTITIEDYNKIEKGMTLDEVTNILGNGEKLYGENTFLITWGNLNLDKYPYYIIQLTFNSENKLINKYQLGL